LINSDHYASLTISIIRVCNVKLDNFNCQEGTLACESAHRDIFSFEYPGCGNTCELIQNSPKFSEALKIGHKAKSKYLLLG